MSKQITGTTSNYGNVTINLWEKNNTRRAYITATAIRGSVGYIDLTSGEIKDQTGNYTIPVKVLSQMGLTVADVQARMR